MAGNNGNGSAELGNVGVAWHDEQMERLQAVFDSVDSGVANSALVEKVLSQLPEAEADPVVNIGVFRDLLRIEHRPDRFRRLLRTWSGKVTAAVRAGHFERAGLWMRSVTESPVFAEEFSAEVAEARRELSREDLLADLVKGLVDAGSPGSAGPLLAAWGEPLIDYLIGQIVVDEPVVNRRHIVEFLGLAGRGDVRYLTARLTDPRWFVVRNVATAIGWTGRPSALHALESALSHEDDRVRVEVLRAMSALQEDSGLEDILRALDDPSPKVRQAATSLLRACPAEGVISGVVEALERGAGAADDAKRLVEIIAERRGSEVEEALKRLSSKKFALGASKAVRDAARTALEGWVK